MFLALGIFTTEGEKYNTCNTKVQNIPARAGWEAELT